MTFELFWRKISQIGLKLRAMPLILQSLTKKVKNLSGRGVNNWIIIPRVYRGIRHFGNSERWKPSLVWYGPGGLLPEKLGGGVRHTSWNPYPISGQNLRFSLPYFRPDQKCDTLFQTCLIISSLGQTNVKGNVYTLFLSGIQNCTKLCCYGTYTVGVNIRREMVLSPNDEEVKLLLKNIL